MTSIAEFRKFLNVDAKRLLREAETSFNRLSFGQPELQDDVKIIVSRDLNTIYFELLDFITWLEDEAAKTKSRTMKVLLDELEKSNDKIRDFQEVVARLSFNFRNKNIFTGMKEYFVKRIRELAAELEQYNDDLDSFGNALSVQKIKNLEASIYQNFEAVGKIKEKMNYLTFSNFPTQRLQLIKLLQSFAEQLEKQYQLSKDLSKAVWLGKTLLSLQLMKRNVDKLIKTVDVTDPKAWKKPLPAFEVFQKHMVEDLESSLKMLGASAEELDKISKRAAAK